ncbi:MAG: hypothetical protein PVH89_05300 [Gammaproteobacteria bacterium]|jgi:hypothetical protein
MNGTVVRFEYSTPHSFLYVEQHTLDREARLCRMVTTGAGR